VKLSKGRVILGVVIVIVALHFLVAVSWIAALAFLFIVACAVLASWLMAGRLAARKSTASIGYSATDQQTNGEATCLPACPSRMDATCRGWGVLHGVLSVRKAPGTGSSRRMAMDEPRRTTGSCRADLQEGAARVT